MGQTQSLTTEGYGEFGKLMAGEAAGCVKSVTCIKTACTADATQTAVGITKCTDTGLDLVDANTVDSVKTTVDNDTVQLDHKFTAATGGETVLGFGVLNEEDDVLYGICCLAAGYPMEASDVLNVQMKIQNKAD